MPRIAFLLHFITVGALALSAAQSSTATLENWGVFEAMPSFHVVRGCVGILDLASSGPFPAWLHPTPSTIKPISTASPCLSGALPGEKMTRSRADDGVFRQSLDPESFRHHVDTFNGMEDEPVVNAIPNAAAWSWMRENVPFFECPDPVLEQIYYYRWWTYRKHIKNTPDGRVLTEFILPVRHAGRHNTVSCALGHHLYEGRWLKDQDLLDEYAHFWLRGREGGPQSHLHKYSSWLADALYQRYRVNHDRTFLVDLLPDLVRDYEQWEREKQLENGLFWQFDVRDGMEESISGSRRARNARPTINSYMYANATAIARIGEMAGRDKLAQTFRDKADVLRTLVQELLWDEEAQFFKVRLESASLADAREAIGFIPWYFNLPDVGHAAAWKQVVDPRGFSAPFGLTTAEWRHPTFRTRGTGTCEWDGAVWPFATSQTLVGMANVLRHDPRAPISKADYLAALSTYAKAHQRQGKPYIGEYLDETTGQWLKGDSPRSRYYNHSTFCDLIISGLIGLQPQADDRLIVHPLVPGDTWDWFALERVPYHGRQVSILWDRTGQRYGRAPGLVVYVDGERVAHSAVLERLEVEVVSGRRAR